MAKDKEETKQLTLVTKLEKDVAGIPDVITDEDDAFAATDALLKVRKLFKEVELKRTQRTAPANETIKLINEDYKKYLTPLKAAEDKLVSVLEDYADRRAEQDLVKLGIVRDQTGDQSLMIPIGLKNLPSPEGEVRFKQGFTATVIDAKKIPKQFLIPDVKAIQKAVVDAEGNIEIPGVQITRSNSASIYVK